MSCMSLKTFESLKLTLANDRFPVVVTATGSSMDPVGFTQCTFDINGRSFMQKFIVCTNQTRPIILGKDFAARNCIGVIWTKQGSRKMVDDEGKTIMEVYEQTKDVPLSLVNSIRIPPNSVVVAAVECNRPLDPNMDIKGDAGFLREYPNIHVARTYITSPMDSNNYIPFSLTNLSMHSQYLGKDKVVGFAEHTTNEVQVHELADYEEIKEMMRGPRNHVPRKKQVKHKLPTVPLDNAFLTSPADVPGPRKVDLQDADVTPATRSAFDELCEKYPTVFSRGNEDIGRTQLISMDIDTGDSPPVSSRPYTLALKHHQWVQEEIETLERAGVITKSMSPWASPIVVVPKKSQPGEPPKKRLCIDFRKINNLQQAVITEGKSKGCLSLVPLPKIDEMYAKLKGAKFFSTIDLRSGYYHIALGKDSRAKTAFVTPFGKYEFLQVPFGLAQAPAYFQHLMNQVLDNCSFAMTYLDDIIIFSETEEEHLAHIEEIFRRLEAADLKMKRSKCDFFKKHIHYLGHLISADGIRPLKDKLDSIRDMPAPRNAKEVKQFLGLVGYYRKFVPRFAALSRPLTKLTCKDKVFEWTQECNKAFNTLKDSLCQQPILKYADTNKGYTLYTDASKYGWAGVLTQLHSTEIEGKTVITDHPVAYVSGLFRGSQLNWAALTKEAYAIYMSVKKLSFYLTDAEVLLKSDHLPLKKFLQKNTLNNKVNNWAMELEAFNIKFQHVSGKTNVLADTLSRLVDIDPDARLDPENAGWEFGYYVFETLPKLSSEEVAQVCEILSGENVIKPDPDLQEPFTQQLNCPLNIDQLQALQAQDEKCTALADMLRRGRLDPLVYSIEDGVMYRHVTEGGQAFQVIYIPRTPPSLIQSILKAAHDDSGHNGFPRTYSAIRRLYYWKGIKEDVRQHCTSCYTCQLHRTAAVKFEAKHFKPGIRPMDFIAIDLIGEFHPPSSQGNRYALTGVCMLTGFTWCIPIKSKKATDVSRAYLQHVYSILGGSTKILTDNGTEFKNEVFRGMLQKLGTEKLIHSPPYRPQSNGRIEGFHRYLKACIAKHMRAGLEWDECTAMATAAYNYFPNMSAKESAFFLMYGRDPVNKLSGILSAPRRYLGDDNGFPDLEALKNMYQMVAQQLMNSRERYVKTNKYNKIPDHGILVGDLVLVKDHTAKSFEPKYKEDFRVVQIYGTNALQVSDKRGKLHNVHITDVRKITTTEKVATQLKEVYNQGRTAKNLIPQGRIPDLGWNTDQQGKESKQLPVEKQQEATVTQTTPKQVEGPPSSRLRSKTKTNSTLKQMDPPERNRTPVDPLNTIAQVNQVQTVHKAGFGWQTVLLLTIIVNLLTTLFLCFRL